MLFFHLKFLCGRVSFDGGLYTLHLINQSFWYVCVCVYWIFTRFIWTNDGQRKRAKLTWVRERESVCICMWRVSPLGQYVNSEQWIVLTSYTVLLYGERMIFIVAIRYTSHTNENDNEKWETWEEEKTNGENNRFSFSRLLFIFEFSLLFKWQHRPMKDCIILVSLSHGLLLLCNFHGFSSDLSAFQ